MSRPGIEHGPPRWEGSTLEDALPPLQEVESVSVLEEPLNYQYVALCVCVSEIVLQRSIGFVEFVLSKKCT
jgi:hypothetical protein